MTKFLTIALLTLLSFKCYSYEDRIKTSRIQLEAIKDWLNEYQRDCGVYPSKLNKLRSGPDKECATKPTSGYIDHAIPLDPWDNEFVYKSEGKSFSLKIIRPNGHMKITDKNDPAVRGELLQKKALYIDILYGGAFLFVLISPIVFQYAYSKRSKIKFRHVFISWTLPIIVFSLLLLLHHERHLTHTLFPIILFSLTGFFKNGLDYVVKKRKDRVYSPLRAPLEGVLTPIFIFSAYLFIIYKTS